MDRWRTLLYALVVLLLKEMAASSSNFRHRPLPTNVGLSGNDLDSRNNGQYDPAWSAQTFRYDDRIGPVVMRGTNMYHHSSPHWAPTPSSLPGDIQRRKERQTRIGKTDISDPQPRRLWLKMSFPPRASSQYYKQYRGPHGVHRADSRKPNVEDWLVTYSHSITTQSQPREFISPRPLHDTPDPPDGIAIRHQQHPERIYQNVDYPPLLPIGD